MKTRYVILAATFLAVVAGVTIGGVLLLGLFSFEHHCGFFAPVWDAEGEYVYFVERETRGRAWGMGWEFFSPPAHARIARDELRLKRLHVASGDAETLIELPNSPLEGKTLRNYRGRIFSILSALVEVDESRVTYQARLSIPRTPTSQVWSLEGTWPQQAGEPEWRDDQALHFGPSEEVLRYGRELIVLPGPESFPCAIILVEPDRSHDVLVQTSEFDRWYPDGVPVNLVFERSRREDIERLRTLRRTKTELVKRFMAEGMNEGTALLRANDELEELGLLPKTPKMLATAIDTAPPDLRVFDIPQQRFDVGLFQDIAAAIGALGEEVDTSTGTYLKYAEDETGVELREWRNDGNDRFVVRTEGRLYLMEILRFDEN